MIANLLYSAPVSLAQTQKAKQVKTVSYTELLSNKARFLGKKVRVKATWITAFEASDICESVCGKLEKAWAEYEIEKGCKTSWEDVWPETNGSLKGANVIVLGTLYEANGKNTFGHMGSYKFKFIINCVEKFNRTF